MTTAASQPIETARDSDRPARNIQQLLSAGGVDPTAVGQTSRSAGAKSNGAHLFVGQGLAP
jgi:hypothetical protein